MRRLGKAILWSAIAAAFIGPGTVTTAASAGASFGVALLWAVLFSVLATYVLQEAAARLTIATGNDLGAVLRTRYPNGAMRVLTLLLVGGAILIGSAAYEAGNILGGLAGAMMAIELPREALTLAVGALAAIMLAFGSPQRIASALAVLVALMGAGFLFAAVMLLPEAGALLGGLVIPGVPEGGALMTVALIGTTVVPYNLFLGSSLARGETLGDTRLGLALAIGIGGLITMGIVVVGAALSGEFTFEAMAALLSERLGSWATVLFALGLLAAGLSSAVTAPLAAALTARGLFDGGEGWDANGWRFRSVWIAVLAIGIGFGLADIRPVPAIVLAQALNGMLLPVIALFLFVAIRDRELLGEHANGPFGSLAMGAVTLIATGLGLVALWKVAGTLFG
ncbi:NRAMP (natural resistance-associated macrophage protein) metal ion transporters [Altererythrobacter xiamenensis]|uniref:NRAMP (Natural resistance-associated macrophage protein) metal ion transporters n=1 Tax=Altererythrobacter xiamenensis TaxID=1316679 RepID=A0A1Y6FNG2_9SPHN|nr:divalent metal cation transporter [Altererythrobacter xiamenensis]SMQ75846.1 NRAMP (natural resistance-associated macrophage protein) metal ion transporters [Altererythrobacter xiamenensis]